MKLTSALVTRTLDQIDAHPIPDNHPAIAQLNTMFGEHTFFLDVNGLHIVEPAASNESGTQTGQVVKLAEWTDASRNSLVPHEPRPSEVIIILDEQGPDNAA